MNFCLPLQISHPNKGKKGKGNVPSNVLCDGTQHVSDRAEPGLSPQSKCSIISPKGSPWYILWLHSHVLRFTNLAEFTVRLFHSHLTTKTLFVFLGAWNAKVKLSSRAVPWWEKTEIATYNSGGVDSQISWKKYMWFEAWRVLLSRSATWNWESLRSCHFLCLKCCLTFLSEHSTNVLGNPQA